MEPEIGQRVRITQEHHPQFLAVGEIHKIENAPGVILPEARILQIKLDNGNYTAAFIHEITVMEEGMMFKQDDTVQTTVCRTSHDGETLIGVGSIGLVTVVGIEVQDGCCNGIEVLFEGKTYGHYKPSELVHAAGNPIPKEDRPAELKKFRTDDPLRMARELVHQLYYSKTGLPLEDVYIVWFCSAVQNWKALVSTNVRDNCYYEVTHNGAKNETYVDRYIKLINAVYHHDTGLVDLTANPDVHI